MKMMSVKTSTTWNNVCDGEMSVSRGFAKQMTSGSEMATTTPTCPNHWAVAVIAWHAYYPSKPSCVTGYLVHMLRARCVRGHRVQQAGQQSSRQAVKLAACSMCAPRSPGDAASLHGAGACRICVAGHGVRPQFSYQDTHMDVIRCPSVLRHVACACFRKWVTLPGAKPCRHTVLQYEPS